MTRAAKVKTQGKAGARAKSKSKNFILADHASERKVKSLLSRLQTMTKKEVEKLAKG